MGKGITEEVKKRWQQLIHDVNVQKANPSLCLRIMLCWDEIFLDVLLRDSSVVLRLTFYPTDEGTRHLVILNNYSSAVYNNRNVRSARLKMTILYLLMWQINNLYHYTVVMDCSLSVNIIAVYNFFCIFRNIFCILTYKHQIKVTYYLPTLPAKLIVRAIFENDFSCFSPTFT